MGEYYDEMINLLEEQRKNMTPEKGKELLVKAGIYDEKVRLTEPYLIQPEHLLWDKGLKGLLSILVGDDEAKERCRNILDNVN